MSKSISEINNRIKELNKKYKETGLTDGKISKKAATSIQGKKNAQSGLLSKIGIKGGKTQGNLNILSGHMDMINSISSKERSERLKIYLSKRELVKYLKNNYYVKDVAVIFGITEVTLRRLIKEYKIDVKEYLKIPTKQMNKKFASGGGAKTNKPILCFYYPEMKPFKKKKFNSIKDANEYFNVTSVSSVVTGKTNSIKWNNRKITFKKID